MNLKFSSVVLQNDNEFKTEYETTYDEKVVDDFIVFNFKDNYDVEQEIWVSASEVKIFFGDQKIELSKGKKIQHWYKTEHGQIPMYWFLRDVYTDFNQVWFSYDLLDSTKQQNIIGTTTINLITTENK
ncbi:hypothetical protein [[Mycoplasma] gypis]|uniref:Uncharacterized protein n=1 Tax=[Mycoplasma] gypis TaxID=92404 RepID=A0ABZ2RNA0_9BACT|nr:hypothetical protein [[Mycoplasma] gypis]MBN0919074.1 hypothetical protein [[Mycoplasma] gypis]